MKPETFQLRLAETIAWCSARVAGLYIDDERYIFEVLRTPTLMPDIYKKAVIEHPDTLPRHRSSYGAETPQDRTEYVEHLARERGLLVNDLGLTSLPATLIGDGRLLVYEPDNDLCDGAAPIASKWFFDENNMPPWDTWVCYVIDSEKMQKGRWVSWSSYLIAWVPPVFLKSAEAGISVNPEECIAWADSLDLPFLRNLNL